MEPSLDLLVQKRDYDFLIFSKKLLNRFSEKLTKAYQLHTKSDRNVNWFRLDTYAPIAGFLVISGNVELRDGDIINARDEGQVLITLDNISKYSNTMRYVLNGKVLEHGRLETLLQHIMFVESLTNNTTEVEAQEILRREIYDETTLLATPQMIDIVEKITRPTVIESFDATTLSKQQIDSLRMSSGLGKGSIQ